MNRGGPVGRVSLSLVLGLVCLAGAARAQSEPLDWTRAWSPLQPLAELPRSLLGAGAGVPEVLVLPAPRVGIFWTAGNPAALLDEVGERRTEFRFDVSDASGAYRRPLDPGHESHGVGSAMVWGPLGERGAGIGRIVFDRGGFDRDFFSATFAPHTTEPYVVLDTLGDAAVRTAVTVEGAAGWKLGRLGLGLGLGYHQQETRTTESAVPKLNRTATPGVTGGATYDLGFGGVRAGVFGRWRQTAELTSLFSVAAASRVYKFRGYTDPIAINLVSTLFGRRFERRAWAVGATLGAVRDAFSWTVFAQRERLTAENFESQTIDPLVDSWDAGGWTVGAAVQAVVGTRRLLLTINAIASTVGGESVQADLDGVPFEADEYRVFASAELRLPRSRGWEGALRLSVARDRRKRSDGVEAVYSDLRAWRPLGAVEIARWFGNSVAVSVGGAVSEHNPSGALPSFSRMGPVYQNWIGPELALYGSEAHSRAGAATVRWRARPSTAFWVRARSESTSPPRSDRTLPGRPMGNRSMWNLTFGVVLGET